MTSVDKCLILINRNAGGSDRITFDKVKACLGEKYAYDCAYLSCPSVSYDGYRAVAVCGGDGTLSSVLQDLGDTDRDVYYFPAGTLNDRAKAERYRHVHSACPSVSSDRGAPVVIGRTGDAIFTYVLAAGSFTPIGYGTDVAKKKRFGVLAYIINVVKEYKVHRIRAVIRPDRGEEIEGDFTLIMFIKSPRCFGFHFNKGFDAEDESGHIVAVRTPKCGIFSPIALFFPFFRVFFMGLKKERDGRIIYRRIGSAEAELTKKTDFCLDGERYEWEGIKHISFTKTKCDLTIIRKY